MVNVKVAVTGQVSSGKSSLCRFLKDLGAVTVSADEIVHHLLLHDPDIQQQLERQMGPSVFVEGHPSREKIAAVVFQEREKLLALEALLHPAVFEEIDRRYREVKGEKIFVAEIPLLFESGSDKRYDKTVTVIRSGRSTCDTLHYEERVARQLSSKEKANRSSIILLNRGSLDDLKKEAKLLFKILLETNI